MDASGQAGGLNPVFQKVTAWKFLFLKIWRSKRNRKWPGKKGRDSISSYNFNGIQQEGQKEKFFFFFYIFISSENLLET